MTSITRSLLRTLCGLALLTPALAQSTPALPLDAALDITTMPLWPGVPAGAKLSSPATDPTLTLFLPQKGKSVGTAVVIAPGGAYLGLASNLEGRQVADWFTARGITAFVLKYRLGKANLYPIPLLDAQQAIRLVRSLAPTYGFAPNRIGMVGFSAGGHLAATAGTLFGKPTGSAPDQLSDRPDFLVLGYPWLNAMQPNDQHLITYCSLIPEVSKSDCAAFSTAYTPALHVTPQTPPTFIYSTTDDTVVPVAASVTFFSALLAAGVPAEMHLYRHGAHGSGLGAGDPALDTWPALLEVWLREQHLLDPRTTAHP